MGLSQTLVATSYFKMIDIWMLFTMIVPFFEVIYHTTIDMFKKSRAAPSCLSKRVDVVNVKPAEEDSVVGVGGKVNECKHNPDFLGDNLNMGDILSNIINNI